LLIPFEVKIGKTELILTELNWVLSKFFKFKPSLVGRRSYYETRFGKFFINPDLKSTITISPSFERREINILLQLIKSDLKAKKKILFIDIGAFYGLYTVVVANEFKKNRNLEIVAFEPDTNYLSRPTFAHLKKNIKTNGIRIVRLYHLGLGSKNTSIPNKVGVKTKKLDTILSSKYAKKFDRIYFKIDVDGYEKSVLEGASNFIRSADSITLLIEDFVDHRIIKYLAKDFEFLEKPSLYNSFWIKNNEKRY
jgi:hypothetical protein